MLDPLLMIVSRHMWPVKHLEGQGAQGVIDARGGLHVASRQETLATPPHPTPGQVTN